MLIEGIHVPLTIPFYRDGRSYLRKLEHNVGRYSLTPAAGLVAMVPGGEAAGLSDVEMADSLHAIAQTAAPEKVLVAGVQKASVRGALEVAEQAAECGFDALLVGAPAQAGDWKRAELLLYFQAIADAAALPVLLWSGAGAAEGGLAVEDVQQLAAHANVIGMYEAELTAERFAVLREATQAERREALVTAVFAAVTRRMRAPERMAGAASFISAEQLGGGAALAVAPPAPALKTRTRTVGFQVMAAGSVAGLLPLLEAGVAGSLPALGACAPQACHEVYAAFKDGNPELAAEKAERLMAADDLMRELGVAAIKYGCDLNGYYGGAPRLPRLGLDGEGRGRVERVLAGLKN